MDHDGMKLTVFFDEPFWTGVFERTESGVLSCAKVVFGAEPTAAELTVFLNDRFFELSFSKGTEAAMKMPASNPKRRKREAAKEAAAGGIGKKAWGEIKAQQEAKKLERKVLSKEKKLASEKQAFLLKQKRRIEKKKGH